MDIQIKNLQRAIALNCPQIKKIVKAILKYQRVKEATLSFVFVTNRTIKVLNKKFLGRSYETDVLSFDLRDPSQRRSANKFVIGEIVISTEMAVKNAKVFGNDLRNEVALYITHGILHLLGYDDHRSKEIKRMRARERMIIKHLGNKIDKLILNID